MTWDLTSYFPSFGGPEMLRFKQALREDIAALHKTAAALPQLNVDSVSAWEDVLLRNEKLMRRMSHLSSYISCLASADGRNESYQTEEAEIIRDRAELGKVRIELFRAFKGVPDAVFAVLFKKPSLRGAENYLHRLREEANRAMSSDKEVLATELGVDGIQSWGQLYNTLSSKLQFEMEFPDGSHKILPISQRRSLLDHPDRRIRAAAFASGNKAWQSIADTAASALNAIAGTRLTLNRHRGVNHFLDVALFQAAITRKTLEAMFDALFANIEIPRRILRFKANLMGRQSVAWYDLGAPLDFAQESSRSWNDAVAMVSTSFMHTYPALGNFFQQEVIGKNWTDWEPRVGKRPGGFCTSSMLSKESRIFMTYNQALGDVLTLAHESGHAYHGFLMRETRPFARSYPMTLAETASTFAEQILINGSFDDPGLGAEFKAVMLDIELGHGAVYLLDIPVRYHFEKAFYEERVSGPLNVSRLKELMVETQRRVLGEVLENGGEDPYFWASKLHFYITGLTFYNFPYTFGYLLSRGLYHMFAQEGATFLPKYEEFLRLAGSDTAENVVKKTVGADLQKPEFWAESIRSLEQPLIELQALAPKLIALGNKQVQRSN
jgi:oligoendopeptidase F